MNWLSDLKLQGECNFTKECKGMFFRGYYSTFYDGNKLENRAGIRFLKSKSCTGCAKCAHFDEYLNESPELVLGMDKVEHGKLYSLRTVNIYRDWESGLVDDYDIEIIEIQNERDTK